MIIYKKVLDEVVLQKIKIYGFYKFLKVAEQNEKLVIWWIQDENSKIEYEKEIAIIGTGIPISRDSGVGYSKTHLDTVLMSNGLVWHVFIS